MLSFKSFIKEESENPEETKSKMSVDITSFLERINSCKTEAGIKELEKYYNSRQKEVDIKTADNITIRDAIEGRREEIASQYEEEEEVAEEV